MYEHQNIVHLLTGTLTKGKLTNSSMSNSSVFDFNELTQHSRNTAKPSHSIYRVEALLQTMVKNIAASHK